MNSDKTHTHTQTHTNTWKRYACFCQESGWKCQSKQGKNEIQGGNGAMLGPGGMQ